MNLDEYELRRLLNKHNLYAIGRDLLERLAEQEDADIVDDSDHLQVVLRKRGEAVTLTSDAPDPFSVQENHA